MSLERHTEIGYYLWEGALGTGMEDLIFSLYKFVLLFETCVYITFAKQSKIFFVIGCSFLTLPKS